MKRRSVLVLLVCMLAVCASPALAEVIAINPRAMPEVVLPEDDAAKLKALQLSASPVLYSDVSPDDTTVVVISLLPTKLDFALVNVNDGSKVAIDLAIQDYGPLTEMRWRDNNTVTYLSATPSLGPLLVTIDKNSGALATTCGADSRLSADDVVQRWAAAAGIRRRDRVRGGCRKPITDTPFDIQLPRGRYRQPGLRTYAYENPAAQAWANALAGDRDTLQAATTQIVLASFDLTSGELVPLVTLPELSIPIAWGWTGDGSTLALVRTTVDQLEQPERGPGGRPGERLASLLVQDTLGALAPADNPLLQGNVVDIFEIDAGNMRIDALRAVEHGGGGTFWNVEWSSDGNTLLAQVGRPSQLSGREHPVFFMPRARSYSSIAAMGSSLNTLERPEADAPYATVARWASPDEVIISTVTGLSGRMYYYNRVSGEFRPIPIPDGSYLEFTPTNLSRQVVFMMMSWQQPLEVFRVDWEARRWRV